MKATVKVAIAVAVMVVGLAATAAAFDVRWNWSRSLPMGLYRIDRSAASIETGDVVVMCPPAAVAALALERGYLARGNCPEGSQPLLKLILGFDDAVSVSEQGFSVAGKLVPFTQPRPTDSEGRSLERWQGRGTGVWVAGPNPWSWDSRYWGPVDRSRILAKARRLTLDNRAIVLAAAVVVGAILGRLLGRRLRVRHA
jgi:conjugative transfer signal peptidase TraF